MRTMHKTKNPTNLGRDVGLELNPTKEINSMNSLALSFNDVQFDVVDRNGSPWIKSRDLANALGYADEKSVNRIYQRNVDEFTDQMVGGVNLTTPSGLQEVRIFSLRGCHLLAMFARTAIAKEFRKWALDILEGLSAVSSQPQISVNKISTKQRGILFDIVAKRSGADGKMRAAMWGKLKKRFKYASYHDLLECHYDDAKKLLETMDLKESFQPEAPSNSYFLSAHKANEFDSRLRSLFDIAGLLAKRGDDIATVFQKQAYEMNQFLAAGRQI